MCTPNLFRISLFKCQCYPVIPFLSVNSPVLLAIDVNIPFFCTWEEDESQELQEDDSVEFPGPDTYSRGGSTPRQPDEVLASDVTYKQ